MTDREMQIVYRDSNECVQEDAYFEARPNLDTPDNRKLFREGYNRGFDRSAEVYNDYQHQK